MTWSFPPWDQYRAHRYDIPTAQSHFQPQDTMASPQQVDSLRENLRQVILEQLTDALLDWPAMTSLSNPVLRVEAFIQEGSTNVPGHQAAQSPLVSVRPSQPSFNPFPCSPCAREWSICRAT